MKLAVYVRGRQVATLERVGDFKSVLSYLPDVAQHDCVSLTMPVRTESYVWDDQLPPILQMNLPEGFLLQVLQEKFGPHVGANPLALLSVIGRNMVGRLQVAAPGADLAMPAQAIEVKALLQGDNSEAAFAKLVREHAASGVSGVVPKFLSTDDRQLAGHKKASLITREHIIKGSSSKLPFIALNEHLSMQVAAQVLPTAKTQISDDGQALVVYRFDVNAQGQLHFGMEDFCALLGMRPANKYETTWERISKAVRDHVPPAQRQLTYAQLAQTLLLTHALRNADCHAKNLALLYTSRQDAHFSPIFDMLTTSVYEGYEHNPPAISFMGKKTWGAGSALKKFMEVQWGISAKAQAQMVTQISDAVSDVSPQVKAAMREHAGFADIGKRMLLAWKEGVQHLREEKSLSLPAWPAGEAITQFSMPLKRKKATEKIGRSPLLGRR